MTECVKLVSSICANLWSCLSPQWHLCDLHFDLQVASAATWGTTLGASPHRFQSQSSSSPHRKRRDCLVLLLCSISRGARGSGPCIDLWTSDAQEITFCHSSVSGTDMTLLGGLRALDCCFCFSFLLPRCSFLLALSG